MSQTSRSNVRPVKGVRNSPSAAERASLLRLTLRAQSRSETVTRPPSDRGCVADQPQQRPPGQGGSEQSERRRARELAATDPSGTVAFRDRYRPLQKVPPRHLHNSENDKRKSGLDNCSVQAGMNPLDCSGSARPHPPNGSNSHGYTAAFGGLSVVVRRVPIVGSRSSVPRLRRSPRRKGHPGR